MKGPAFLFCFFCMAVRLPTFVVIFKASPIKKKKKNVNYVKIEKIFSM